jgi:hypothetical protein
MFPSPNKCVVFRQYRTDLGRELISVPADGSREPAPKTGARGHVLRGLRSTRNQTEAALSSDFVIPKPTEKGKRPNLVRRAISTRGRLSSF